MDTEDYKNLSDCIIKIVHKEAKRKDIKSLLYSLDEKQLRNICTEFVMQNDKLKKELKETTICYVQSIIRYNKMKKIVEKNNEKEKEDN
jgi:hypothetical protein